MCFCANGFSGDNCSQNVDECGSSPCQPGGTCTDGIASFTCACSPGLTGVTCQSDIDECAVTSCDNGGTCVNSHGSFACNCQAGFTGSLCQVSHCCKTAVVQEIRLLEIRKHTSIFFASSNFPPNISQLSCKVDTLQVQK